MKIFIPVVFAVLICFINNGQALKCPASKLSDWSCKNDNTRVRSRTHYVVKNGECLLRYKYEKFVLTPCVEKRKLKKCPDKKGQCDGFNVSEKQVWKNCKKVWVVTEKQPIKCCCGAKSRMVQRWDAKWNRVQVIQVGVTLTEGGRCESSETYIRTFKLNCMIRRCTSSTEKCIGGQRIRKIKCVERRGTKCHTDVKSYKEGCGVGAGVGCPGGIKTNILPCAPKADSTELVQYIFVYNSQSGKCDKKEINRASYKCKCAKATRHANCEAAEKIYKTVKVTSEVLKDGVCYRTEYNSGKKATNCPYEKKLIFDKSYCKKNTGFGERVRKWRLPVDWNTCECKVKTLREKIVCCCLCIKMHSVKVKCENGNMGTFKETSRVQTKDEKGNPVCAKKVVIIKRQVNCPKSPITRVSKCQVDEQTGNSYITTRIVDIKLVNCECKHTVVSTTKKLCGCKKYSKTNVICDNNEKFRVVTTRKLIGDACKDVPKRTPIPVVCKKNYKKLVQPCNKNRQLRRKIVTYSKKNCECKEDKTYETCGCNCGKASKSRNCIPAKFQFERIVITVSKSGCGCKRNKNVKYEPGPSCSGSVQNVDKKCDRSGSIGYRRIRVTTTVRDIPKCKCKDVYTYHKKICHCKKKNDPRTQCINNGKTLQTKIYAYRIDKARNKCKWVQIDKREKTITCPKRTRTPKCNKKTNKLTITITNYLVVGCKCIPKTSYVYGKCSCDPTKRIFKTHKCQKNCRQKVEYEWLERKGKINCQRKTSSKTRQCCCKPSFTTKKHCVKHNLWRHTDTTYKLNERRKCVADVKYRNEPVSCSKRKRVTNNCQSKRKPMRGKFVTHQQRAINCKCKWRPIGTVTKYCYCPDDNVGTRCDKARSRFVTKIISYTLTKSRNCKPTTNFKYRTVVCKPKTKKVHTCQKNHRQKVVFTWYELSDQCQCVRKTNTIEQGCDCEGLDNDSTKCDEAKGELVTTIKKYKFVKGDCVATQTQKTKTVTCRPRKWRFLRRGSCLNLSNDRFGKRYFYYYKRVRDGCGCKKLKDKRECDCFCKGKPGKVVCEGDTNVYYRFKYRWTDARKCACKQTSEVVKRVPVKCPKSSTTKGKCNVNNCRRQDTIHYYVLTSCSCERRTRYVYNKCCCGGTWKSKKCLRGNIIMNTVLTERKMKKKCCKKFVSTFTSVVCPRREKVQPVSECDDKTDTQRVRIAYYQPYNCGCRQRIKLKYRPCVCARRFRTRDERCRRNQKYAYLNIFRYRYDLKGNRCIPAKPIRIRKVCRCSSRKPTKKCVRGMIHRTSQVCRVLYGQCTCQSIVIRRHPCCPQKTTYKKQECDGNRVWAVSYKYIHYQANCQCKIQTIPNKKRCKCPGPKTTYGCENDRFWVTYLKTYSLSGNECPSQTTPTKKTLSCNHKKPLNTLTIRCGTKQRCIATKVFRNWQLKKCKCIERRAPQHFPCCCKSNRIEPSCVKGRINRRTFYKYRFSHLTMKCSETVNFIDKPVVCAKDNVVLKRGKCNIKRAGLNSFFRTVVYRRVRIINCKCVVTSVPRIEWCGCFQPYKEGSCKNNRVKLELLHQYRKKGKGCIKTQQVINAIPVRCPRRTLRRPKGCPKSGVRKVKIETYVLRDCNCERKVSYRTEPCRCTPIHDKKCIRNVWHIRKSAGLLVCHANRLCQCCKVAISLRTRPVCQQPTFKTGLCVNHVTYMTVTSSVYKNCQCHSRARKIAIPCNVPPPNQKYCRDRISVDRCIKARKAGKCEKEVKIQRLCRRTCNYCGDCEGHVSFTRREVVKRGVVRKVYDFFLLYLSIPNKIHCEQACKETKLCKSFTIRRASGSRRRVCLLSGKKQRSLRDQLRRAGSFTSQYARLFDRICRPRCDRIRYKVARKCTCPYPKAKVPCFRRVTIIRDYVHPHHGSCMKKVETVQSPCKRTCVDSLPPSACKGIRRRNKCKKPENRVLCNKTCFNVVCDCDSIQTKKSRCYKRGKVWYRKVYTEYYKKYFGVCTLRITVKEVRDKSCYVKPVNCNLDHAEAKDCIAGTREVHFYRYFKTKKGTCDVKVTVKKFNCRGCCPEVQYTVGSCRRGKRRVKEVYYVRQNNCCVAKEINNVYWCNTKKCRKSRIVRGKCIMHKLPKYNLWYSYDAMGKCRRHLVTKLENC